MRLHLFAAYVPSSVLQSVEKKIKIQTLCGSFSHWTRPIRFSRFSSFSIQLNRSAVEFKQTGSNLWQFTCAMCEIISSENSKNLSSHPPNVCLAHHTDGKKWATRHRGHIRLPANRKIHSPNTHIIVFHSAKRVICIWMGDDSPLKMCPSQYPANVCSTISYDTYDHDVLQKAPKWNVPRELSLQHKLEYKIHVAFILPQLGSYAVPDAVHSWYDYIK